MRYFYICYFTFFGDLLIFFLVSIFVLWSYFTLYFFLPGKIFHLFILVSFCSFSLLSIFSFVFLDNCSLASSLFSLASLSPISGYIPNDILRFFPPYLKSYLHDLVPFGFITNHKPFPSG